MNSPLKFTQENIELRRGKVLELSSQGYNQSEISRMLNCSIGLISIDMQYIRTKAKESIREYIDEKLPEEYSKCLSGLNSILKESWTISHKTEDSREKISALSLAKECYNAKLELLTNVDVIEDVVKFINKEKGVKETVSKDEEEPVLEFQNANTEEEIEEEQEEDDVS